MCPPAPPVSAPVRQPVDVSPSSVAPLGISSAPFVAPSVALMRILIRTSKWAVWARRFGALALPLAAIPVLLHRLHIITSDNFIDVEAVALGIALWPRLCDCRLRPPLVHW